MRAIVLAAGTGSRLMPFTADRPKCMVELAERGLIDRQIDVLQGMGIDDITIVGGYQAECLEKLGVPILINEDYERTNMVWTFMCARDLLDGRTDVLMTYGDIVYEPKVLRAVIETPGDVVVAADRLWQKLWSVRMDDPLADAETFRVDRSGCIVELGNKPSALDEIQGQYLGIVRFHPNVHAKVKALYDQHGQQFGESSEQFRNMYMTSFLQTMIDDGWRLPVAWTDSGWLEVDSVADLEVYQRLYASGELSTLCRLAPAHGKWAL